MLNKPLKTTRRGSKTVEVALALPILTFTVFGGIEIGRGAMIKNVLEEAARAGCRVAVLQDSNRGDVEQAVNRVLQASDVRGNHITIEPADLSKLAPLERVTVTVSVPYKNVSLFTPDLLHNFTLAGICVMPAEIEIDEALILPNPSSGKKNKKNKSNKKNKKGKRNAKK